MRKLDEGTFWIEDIDMLVSLLVVPDDHISCIALTGDLIRPQRVPGGNWAVVKEQCRRRGISSLVGLMFSRPHDWKSTGKLGDAIAVRIAFPEEFDHDRNWGHSGKEIQARIDAGEDLSGGRGARDCPQFG